MQPKYGMFCDAAVSGHVQELVHIPEAKQSREAYPPTEGCSRRLSLEWWRYAGCESAAINSGKII